MKLGIGWFSFSRRISTFGVGFPNLPLANFSPRNGSEFFLLNVHCFSDAQVPETIFLRSSHLDAVNSPCWYLFLEKFERLMIGWSERLVYQFFMEVHILNKMRKECCFFYF